MHAVSSDVTAITKWMIEGQKKIFANVIDLTYRLAGSRAPHREQVGGTEIKASALPITGHNAVAGGSECRS